MSNYYLDFETSSDLPIHNVSTYRYLSTPNSRPLCMSWSKNKGKVNLWLPGMPQPFLIRPEDRFYGLNIGGFDIRVWNELCVKRYGWEPMPVQQVIDVQALAGRLGYPQNLDQLGKVLKVKTKKDARGQQYIKKCCTPPFDGTQEDLHGLYKYCIGDTKTLIEIVDALPMEHLEIVEAAIWELTNRINSRGIPLDMRAIRRIKEVVDFYKSREVKRLPALTDDFVKTPGQVAKIREWCLQKGVRLSNLQKATVEEVIEDPNLPPTVKAVLQLRLNLGQSSLAKYKALLDLSWRGRVYDNLRYYRASTGRFGGQGFQAHNLPRASVENPEDYIDKFYDGTILQEDVMFAAKALIRPMIKAEDGKIFCISDYSSIEYILLMWLAREWEAVHKFARGRDPYKDQGVELFGKPYDEITKDERQKCKPIVLGAGYLLGAKGLIEYAKQYDVDMTLEEAAEAVRVYRQSKPLVKKLWYRLSDASVYAVSNPGRSFDVNGCTFYTTVDRHGKLWLCLKLPSGRIMYYESPKLFEGEFGWTVTFMGEYASTHQWIRMELGAPRIIENIIQALGRDLLCFSKLTLDAMKYYQVLSVHDETVTVLDLKNAEKHKAIIHRVMSTPAKWCADLPLKADTFLSKRYKKG